MITTESLQGILVAALQAANERQDEFRFRFSAAGDPCLRALVLDARDGPRPIKEIKHALANVCGTAVGDLLEEGCAKLGWKVQKEAVLVSDDVEVSGKLDVQGPGFVLDWKLVGENAWKRVQREPNSKHVFQCNGYSKAVVEPRWVLAYLRATSIFKPGELEWRIYSGSTSTDLAKQLVNVWAKVQTHMTAGTLPDRDASFSRERFPCGGGTTWQCAHFAKCWEGERHV